MIFGMFWDNLTWKSYRFDHLTCQMSPLYLGKSKKSFYNSIIDTYFWLFTLSQKKTNCNPLDHPTWKCHHNNLWNAKLFQLSNVWGSEESQLWVVISGSEKNRLWCVATGMSGKQRHSKCSEWPPSALTHASCLFSTMISHMVHHGVLKFSPCHNKPLPQAVSVSICALLL